LRDNHRLFCPGLMEWNRSATTNVRHINGAVFRRDLDVAVESSAIIDRIQGERRPEGETAILTHRRARIGDALRRIINRVRISRDWPEPARMKYSAAEGFVIDVRWQARAFAR